MHPLLKQPTVYTNKQESRANTFVCNSGLKEDINKLQTTTNIYLCKCAPTHTHKQTVILRVKTTISQILVTSMFEFKLRNCTVPHELAQFVKQTKMFLKFKKVYSQAFHLTTVACVLFVSVCFCGSSLCVGEW